LGGGEVSKAQELRARTYRGTHLRDTKGVYAGKEERFPSVTKVLGVMNKPALPRWASKSVAEHVAEYVGVTVERDKIGWANIKEYLSDVDSLKNVPWDYAEKRRDLGSTFHDIAEQYVAGAHIAPEVFADDVRPLVESFLTWCDEFKPEWEAMECGVFNRTHNYAGTMDAIVRVNGRLMVLDYKTSKDSYPEHALQLSAYRYAEFLGLANGDELTMPEVDGGAILLVQPGKCKMLEWPCEPKQFDAFIALRRAHDFVASNLKPMELSPCLF
jgi:hypothetical protein